MTHSEARELVEIVFGLHDVFDDFDKVAHWLVTENPHLGKMRPIDTILWGDGHKVLKFVRSCQADNQKEIE